MSQTELNKGRVKVGDMREVGRQEFLDLLDQLAGTKVLVWDPALTGPMGLVAEYSTLKEHEVISRGGNLFIQEKHFSFRC